MGCQRRRDFFCSPFSFTPPLLPFWEALALSPSKGRLVALGDHLLPPLPSLLLRGNQLRAGLITIQLAGRAGKTGSRAGCAPSEPTEPGFVPCPDPWSRATLWGAIPAPGIGPARARWALDCSPPAGLNEAQSSAHTQFPNCSTLGMATRLGRRFLIALCP